MKKFVFLYLLLIAELFGIATIGYVYSQNEGNIILIVFIVLFIFIMVITSCITIYLLKIDSVDHPQEPEKHKECPYFIDKDIE